jgi:hypothetical protein
MFIDLCRVNYLLTFASCPMELRLPRKISFVLDNYKSLLQSLTLPDGSGCLLHWFLPVRTEACGMALLQSRAKSSTPRSLVRVVELFHHSLGAHDIVAVVEILNLETLCERYVVQNPYRLCESTALCETVPLLTLQVKNPLVVLLPYRDALKITDHTHVLGWDKNHASEQK